MIYIFRTCLPGWDMYDLQNLLFARGLLSYTSTDTSIIIGTRSIRDRSYILHDSASMVVADLDGCRAGSHAHTAQLHKHMITWS